MDIPRKDNLRPCGSDIALQVTSLELEHHAAESKQCHDKKK
jgi:hypothetical protein